MADEDLTAEVNIRNDATGEERTIPAGAVPFFTNPESGSWVLLDAAGRKKANQSTTAGKEN